MLSSALVVFREVFEIVLIVGIILAVTRTMPNRKKAIAIGFGAGIVGSALIAVFTGQISTMAEGLGQEYFNAGILLTAAGFIAWTVLWMKKHARHIKKHFQDVERAIESGKAPYIALSGIIGLAMLREGAEIVLFIYGMLAAGQSPETLMAGSALGFIGGLAVGLMVYFGLIKLSIKIFFQVTSLMLAFLVAGMVSQGIGFLVAAGMFENLSQTAWDTSAFLTEDGIIGQSIGVLIGYTARPAVVQVIAYAATLAFIMIAMRMIDKDISILGFFKKPEHA
jgi:high-affinity iron transporter